MGSKSSISSHPYLVAKKLEGVPHQQDTNGNILCPIHKHGNDELLSFQRISPDLQKPKLKDAGKPCAGGYWFINDHAPQPNDRVIVAEGYSTGWAIYLMCEQKVPVAVSYGCSAMGAVALDLHAHWGACPVLAPDSHAALPPECDGFALIACEGFTPNYDWCDWRIDNPEKTPIALQRISDDPIFTRKNGFYSHCEPTLGAPALVQSSREDEGFEEGCEP